MTGSGRQQRRASSRRRRTLRWLAVAAVVVAGALAIDAVYVARTLARDGQHARDQLELAVSRLDSGDVSGAVRAFEEAHDAATAAHGAAEHPAAIVASALPVIGDDVAALRALADAGRLATAAGVDIGEAAQASGWNGTSVPGFEAGRVDLDVLRTAEPRLTDAASLLSQARTVLEAVRATGKLASIADAITSAKRSVDLRASQAERVQMLVRFLTSFLGGDGPRTYGVVMMSLADPRGSGGYPGTFGVLHVDDGRLDLTDLAPTGDLGKVPPVDAPPDVVHRYARFGALRSFIASTYSPDWPTSARLWSRMWVASGRQPLDGVIGADSVFMADVLQAIGPVSTSAWPEPISVSNAREVIDADPLRTTDRDSSNATQAAIATALWEAIISRSADPTALAGALVRASEARHLQIYSAAPAEEAALDALDASGRIRMPDDPLMVSWSGLSPSRTGYFAEKSIDYRARIAADGSASVAITVALSNGAPTGPPSLLLGLRSDPYPVGTYLGAASVYVPADATGLRVVGRGALVELYEREFDRRVAMTVLRAGAGTTTSARIAYRIPASGTGGFRVGIVPQPELHPTSIHAELTFPPGTLISSRATGTTLAGSTVTYEGAPTTPVTLWAVTSR